MGLSWPVEYGGRGMSLAAEAVLAEELARSGAAEIINRLALYTWGPTLMDMGEPEQLRRFLPGMLDASQLWCQGFSEPDAGSDLAGVRTRAVVDGEELVITGQKVWTSRAELSTWNALLVRTDGEPGQHQGLTLVITPMQSAGITIRPLPQMLGEPHFSEVFFDEVRVPVANVLGGLDQGWRVSMKAMGYERGIFVLERSIRLRRRLAELAGRVRDQGGLDRAALAGIGRVHASLEMLHRPGLSDSCPTAGRDTGPRRHLGGQALSGRGLPGPVRHRGGVTGTGGNPHRRRLDTRPLGVPRGEHLFGDL